MPKFARKIITNPDGGTVTLYGDLAEQYQTEIDAHAASDCQHTERELRTKILSGGGPMCKEQCLSCGAPIGNPVSKRPDLPKWDHVRHAKYLSERAAKRVEILRKFVHRQAAENDKLSESIEDRRAEYQAYRRTPKWQAKRSKVMGRANGACEG